MKKGIRLNIYNTLARKIEPFKPIKEGEVKMYVCGPTVNDVPHLGHARMQISFDLLRKFLVYLGYKVKFVSNITDIDDKIINKANETGEEISKLTKRNIESHLHDYELLGIEKPDVQPKATEYLPEMIELIKILEKKGFTYITKDGVYFNVSKFPHYGVLSRLNKEKSKSRVKNNEQKKNKEDFVLWKFSKPGEPSWNSPWGEGRPGWHIECSAMSQKILGLPFDIHCGGQDLIFPHHEDEIAQSEAAYGKKLANYWIHNGLVNVENIKMSKSLGNFTTIKDLLNVYSPKIIRYFILLTNYRKPIDFTNERLESAKSAYEKIRRKIIGLKNESHKGNDKTENYETRFAETLGNDLNTPKVIQIIRSIIDDFDFDSNKKLLLLLKFDKVLGLGIKEMHESRDPLPKEIQDLLEERNKMRKDKLWKESDRIRNILREMGYSISDTPEGQKVEKII